MKPIITSVLQTDLYKFTMMNAIVHLYPHAWARYRFINRANTHFPVGFDTLLRYQVEMMRFLKLSKEERIFLEKSCSFLPPPFLDILSSDKLFDSSHVDILWHDHELDITIEGPWYKTVLWETPLMAIISELFFSDRQIGLKDVRQAAIKKGEKLREAGCITSDFGTRRRASEAVQREVILGLKGAGSYFVGTSNMDFARQMNLKPIGTQAHEWFQFHAAKYGFVQANSTALGRWVDVYSGRLGIALTDTFGTADFWKNFGHFYARLFDGVRHDSGNEFNFGEKAIEHYKSLGIDPLTKTIVFSDGLTVDKACALQKHFNGRIKCAFGIGTHFTNDIPGIVPLNMVIKMVAAKPDEKTPWLDTVKLSDVEGKNTGSPESIRLCKQSLGL